jgi:hypothetical protein
MPPASKPKPKAKSNSAKNAEPPQKTPIKDIRFIFACHTDESSHVNTFLNAAATLEAEYKKKFPNHRVEKHHIKSAVELNKILSSQPDLTVRSVDIIGHGRYDRIGIMDDDYERTSIMMDDVFYFFKFWFSDMLEVEDLDFRFFAINAKIEVHGCRTADKEHQDNNIIRNLSMMLYEAGKTKSYVIGHGNKAQPKPGKKAQDYRHDARFIYHNGQLVIFQPKKGEKYTIQEGHLDESAIEKAIEDQFGTKK